MELNKKTLLKDIMFLIERTYETSDTDYGSIQEGIGVEIDELISIFSEMKEDGMSHAVLDATSNDIYIEGSRPVPISEEVLKKKINEAIGQKLKTIEHNRQFYEKGLTRFKEEKRIYLELQKDKNLVQLYEEL